MASIVRPGPCQMVLLRHAEKTGRPQDRGLSLQGERRAAALAEVFSAHFGLPDVIIACRSTARSTRPVDTVQPLANQLGLAVDDQWGTQDYGALAEAVSGAASYANKSLLICWRHDTLQGLARALGATDAPPWPEALYDCAWILRPSGPCMDFAIGRQGIPPHLIEPSLNQ